MYCGPSILEKVLNKIIELLPLTPLYKKIPTGKKAPKSSTMPKNNPSDLPKKGG